MGYQQEYMKNARARCAYTPGIGAHRPTGCMDNNKCVPFFFCKPACTFTRSFAAAFAV